MGKNGYKGRGEIIELNNGKLGEISVKELNRKWLREDAKLNKELRKVLDD